MAELTTTARPYAKAVFELAEAGGDYERWSNQLRFLAAVAADDAMASRLDNPRLTRASLAELICGIGEGQLDEDGRNLVRLLAENRRLRLLPAIAPLYEELRGEAQGTVGARVTAAMPVSDAQQKAIATALKTRLGREVELECDVDEALIGGAVIRAGDLVIDGSVTGRLKQMASSLRH
ncbi:MAG: F0F1 ATP synthase subunit delta [Pseudomonadota bacterium]